MTVLLAGDLAAATTYQVGGPIRPGANYLVMDHILQSSGVAANMAMGLRGLGQEVAVWGAVGPDALGDMIRKDLARVGIGTSLVKVAHRSTPLFCILVLAAAEKAMIGTVGANAELGLSASSLASALEQLQPDWVHLSGYSLARLSSRPLQKLLRVLTEGGVMASVDLEGLAASEQHPDLEGLLVLGNLEEYQAYFKESRPTPKAGLHLVVKMGSDGCLLMANGQARRFPGFHVASVDSTGAGDAFNAGFIDARLRGMDESAACRRGNAMGALCATVAGPWRLTSSDEIDALCGLVP